MDNFEVFMFEKINQYRIRLEESKDNKDVAWAMNNCLEEFMEILSHYNLNCKNW